jgi:dTDP-glucose 4,6-dehydratase
LQGPQRKSDAKRQVEYSYVPKWVGEKQSAMHRVLVTGGAGFIGSTLVKYLVREIGAVAMNVDKLTYAGTLSSLADVEGSNLYQFFKADIADAPAMRAVLGEFRPEIVMHLAAETHVDRSIDGPKGFIDTNVVGTAVLLEEAYNYWRSLSRDRRERFRFHHVSTDEVYGSVEGTTRCNETTRYDPSSPYSASKAAADHVVRAWHRTYNMPVILSSCGNNYGPYQFPEKFIPMMILKALGGEPLPVYGRGENVRDWLFVEDHVRALWRIAMQGRVGETYLVGGNAERRNIDVARQVCGIVDELVPDDAGSRERLISFVADRPGHDFRYALDSSRVQRELRWSPRESFESGLRRTVIWYLDRRDWWEPLAKEVYRGQRLGHLPANA